MNEITAIEREQQRASWHKRFRFQAKKLCKHVGKAITRTFLCTAYCVKRDDHSTDNAQRAASASVSVETQTKIPFIVDQLRHRGETMTHRAPLNYISSKDPVMSDSQSGSSSNSQQPIGIATITLIRKTFH